jgi:nucleoside-triphosphatase THEP1
MVNTYNSAILQRWRANMDLQLIGSLDPSDDGTAYACGEYVCNYMTKGEPEQIRKAVHEGLARLPADAGQKQQLSRVGTSLLRLRLSEYSLQESTYLLLGLLMRGCSRKIAKLSVGFPENRVRIATTKAMSDAQEEDEVAVASNVYDRYAQRPEEHEDMTLCQFVTEYDVVSAQPKSGEWFKIEGAERWAKKRTKAAVLRSFPRMTTEAHGEEYYYHFFLLHRPWREELTDLLAGLDTYEVAFAALEPELRENIGNERFADEIEAAVARIEALEEDQQHHIHRAVAPGAMAAHGEHAVEGARLDDAYAVAHGELFVNLDAALHGALAGNEGNDAVGELNNAIPLDVDDATRIAGTGRMSNSRFQAHKSQLSQEQCVVFNEVQQHIRASQNPDISARPKPLHLFVTGGAGVGKSFLIQALHELIIRGHMGVVRKPVKLTAPTGVFAFNIMGTTLHTALSVPVKHCKRSGRARVKYIRLNDQKLQALCTDWAGAKYHIIDDISMVSLDMLGFVHRRLGEIMDNDLPFGGLPVICIGDFFQLPPVKADYIFHQAPGVPLQGHLWKDPEDGFQGRVLLQNQRQRGDNAWATHLNALRVA